MKNYLLLTAAVLGSVLSAHAALTLNNFVDPTTVDDAYGLTLTDFNNNAANKTVMVGNQAVGGQFSYNQPYGAGTQKWVQGDNPFTFTCNPSSHVETFVGGGITKSFTEPAFAKTINEIHFQLSARNGASDIINFNNFAVTSLDGTTSFLTSQSISSGYNSYKEFQIVDNSGLLANGFVISGTLNLPNGLSTYSKSQTDKLAINVGNVAVAPGAPAPPMTACFAFAGVLLLQAFRRTKQVA
ncbi:MAG: hypothetical protein WCP60_07565 [bacterium]